MIYGCETWKKCRTTEMHMVRLCVVLLRERKISDELRNMIGKELVLDVLRMGNVLRRDGNNWARRVLNINVDRGKQTTRKTKENVD